MSIETEGDGYFAKWLGWECCPKCKVKLQTVKDLDGCKIYRCVACRMKIVNFKGDDDE